MDLGANTNYKYNSQLINARSFYLYIPNSGIYNVYYTVQYDSIYVSPIHRECFVVEYSEH